MQGGRVVSARNVFRVTPVSIYNLLEKRARQVAAPPLLRFELEKRILSWTDETHLFSLENQTKSFHCVIDRVLPVCSNCYRDWFPSECPCFTFTYLLCGYFSFFKITFWINIYLIKGYGLVFSYFACYPVQTKPVNLLISPVYGSLMSLNDDVNHCKLSKLIRTH